MLGLRYGKAAIYSIISIVKIIPLLLYRLSHFHARQYDLESNTIVLWAPLKIDNKINVKVWLLTDCHTFCSLKMNVLGICIRDFVANINKEVFSAFMTGGMFFNTVRKKRHEWCPDSAFVFVDSADDWDRNLVWTNLHV